MNIGIGIGKQLPGMLSAWKNAEGVSRQTMSASMRIRMAHINEAQSTLPQAKREVIYDAASGTTFDTQRMNRSAVSTQKQMKKLQYNFKLISSQIMRAKTSSSAARAVSSARRLTAQLRRKKKSGEYDDAELEAAISHALAMERVAKKHVKNLQQEEIAKRGAKENEPAMREDEMIPQDSAAWGEMQQIPNQENEIVPQEMSDIFSEISREFTEEMMMFMQEYEELLSETVEDIGGALMESLSIIDTDMDAEDIKELKQKHRAKEMQEIARADAKYLKAIFEKYATDHSQSVNGVNQNIGAMTAFNTNALAATVPVEGKSVDVSV
ncbi:MAG: hypothetical protein PUD20_00715 [bacterium]|nr:hypothetical protein [bacterium]